MHRTKNSTSAFALFSLVLVVACGSPRAYYKFQLQKVSQGDSLSDVSARIAKPLTFENADFKIDWSPGQQKGDNSGGIAGQLSPGFDGGGFFAEAGDLEEVKKAHAGKTAQVVLNISQGAKAQTYRFALQVADITAE